jgi:superfamily II DNA or RNA helicase
MKEFANWGGKARWITSPILSKEDWNAIQVGDKAKRDSLLKQALIHQLLELSLKNETDILVTFSWMIADGVIELKLAKPRNKLTNEFHAKVGIFTDNEGNSISFDGSINDSEHGLYNYESIKIFRSWDQTADYVSLEKIRFESLWNNLDENVEVFDIPEAVIENIIELRKNSSRPYKRNATSTGQIINSLAKESPEIPQWIDLRDYQKEAISNWFKNNNKGTFEMATGTGKTITALAALTKLVSSEKHIIGVILCPYIHLAQQWKDEAEKFGYQPILIAESANQWISKLQSLCRDFAAHRIENGLIISTNSSFESSKMREIIDHYEIWKECVLIADEVHHCGSEEMIKALPKMVNYRLGLSATPVRGYDEDGTSKMFDYFGDICFSFTLKDAIQQGYLTPYKYYPLPIYMTNDEFAEYIQLSKKLSRMHPNSDDPISQAALFIAIKRARVLNNSVNKLEWVRQNISSSDEFFYTLFYVGENSFDQVLRILGFEKRLLVHEFTHRQSRSERAKLIDLLSDRKIQAFVAMKCLDEGVDIPPTRVAYFLASSSVSREFVQRRGRVLRNSPGKKSASIFDLISIPPEDLLVNGKLDANYSVARSALRREFLRVSEFASLAENKHQAMDQFIDIANRYDLLDI